MERRAPGSRRAVHVRSGYEAECSFTVDFA